MAEIGIWDPNEEESIKSALKGIAAAVSMVGVAYTDFHLHPNLMQRVIDAAIAQKVDRLLYSAGHRARG